MQCSACGRESANPNANYCDYCGTMLRNVGYQESFESVQQKEVKTEAKKEDRVSTWLFLGIMCLPMVPVVGGIAYLVFLFFWAFAPSITDSKKSFARATLIYTIIMLILVIAVMSAMVGMMTGANVLNPDIL